MKVGVCMFACEATESGVVLGAQAGAWQFSSLFQSFFYVCMCEISYSKLQEMLQMMSSFERPRRTLLFWHIFLNCPKDDLFSHTSEALIFFIFFIFNIQMMPP